MSSLPSSTFSLETTQPNNGVDGSTKTHPYIPHNGENRQYMRDIILGINDGLVSTFLIVFAMSGSNAPSAVILLTGVATAIAGAISMALGEYIATAAQNEVLDGELNLEKEHFVHHREIELEEIREKMMSLGVKGKMLEDCVKKIGENDETLMKFMMITEFGYVEDEERHPLISMAFSGCLFLCGALPSIVPFIVTSNVTSATIAAGVLCSVALFTAGAVKTISTRGSLVYDGVENLLFGMVGAGISYAIGVIYQKVSSG